MTRPLIFFGPEPIRRFEEQQICFLPKEILKSLFHKRTLIFTTRDRKFCDPDQKHFFLQHRLITLRLYFIQPVIARLIT
jgi:hypothetical protein